MTVPKPPRKSAQRRDLTLDRILDATLEVLASSDPSALTMRRVAEHCGVSAMAIYHHVDDKEKLAALAVDRLFLEATQQPRNGDDWRAQLVDLWCGIRQRLLATPGAGMIWVRGAVIGPGTATVTEVMFQLLRDGGLHGQAIAEASDAMTMLAIGSIANELTRPQNIKVQLGDQLPAEDAPQMQDVLDTYATRDGTERYLVALNWLLDGVVQRASDAG